MTLTLLDAPWRPEVLTEGLLGGSGPTLDDLVFDAWEVLAVGRRAPCPVCAGAMVPRYGAGPGPVGGRCADCGSELS